MLHCFFGVPGAHVWTLAGLCTPSAGKVRIGTRACHSADYLPDAFMCNIHQVLMCSAATVAGFGGKSEPIACRVRAYVCHWRASGLDQMIACTAHVLTLPARQTVELHALVAGI